jgi:hypothetical protein
MFCGGYAQVL